MFSRRIMLGAAAAAPVLAGAGRLVAQSAVLPKPPPIGPAERAGRIAKLQSLMQAVGIGAFLVESGASLDYFTGIRWSRSERTTAAVIPAHGEVVIVTPVFEEPSVRETLAVSGDVRPWNEHESPFVRIAQALADRGVATGKLAVEPTIRFFIVDGVRKAASGLEIVSGNDLIRACRMVKSPAELALMQAANTLTLAALKVVHGQVQTGMATADVAALMNKASASLGGAGGFALVLLNEASAYPHGSAQVQTVREGSVILMDCGTSVHGYESDISRSWVHGTPTARQRTVWDTVKRGQEIAVETARPGTPVGRIDDAVRAYFEKEGWGPAYHLPGLSHRTGHGIGMEGHEAPYLVHGDETPLAPGMCFSDEPGLYIPGAFGIRLEDCWYMTETGPKLFTPLARSLDDPI